MLLLKYSKCMLFYNCCNNDKAVFKKKKNNTNYKSVIGHVKTKIMCFVFSEYEGEQRTKFFLGLILQPHVVHLYTVRIFQMYSLMT